MSLAEFLRSLPSEDDGAAAGSFDMHDASVPLNDDTWQSAGSPARKKQRAVTATSALGINIQDDFFTVPELQRRPLPREDGYTESEQDAWVARTRPFGREYLNEQEERLRILSQNKNYRFVREVAGALRKDPLQVVEEEDLARVMRERARERREEEAELRRTKLTVNEKSEAVRRLEGLLAELHARFDRAQAARADPFLLELSERLIDESSPVGLMSLVHQVLEYQLLARIQPGDIRNGIDQSDAIARVERFADGENERLQETMEHFATQLGRRYYAFLLYVYYRDFLDNEAESMSASFAAKLAYTASVVRRSGGDPDDKTVAMPELLVVPLNANAIVDWSTYRGTETLNMNYYLSLGIFTDTEQTLLDHLDESVYSATTLAILRAFVYDGAEKPDFRQAEYAPLLPLVERLKERTYAAQRLVVRSHLLWLHYSEVGLTDLVNTLFAQAVLRSAVANKIHDLAVSLAPQLEELLNVVYVPLVDQYLEQLREYLRARRSITGTATVFRVPDGALGLTGDQEAYRQSDTLVLDAQFRDYLQRGDAIFRLQRPGAAATTSSESTALRLAAPPDQYPVLVLHLLFREYQRYLAAYTRATEQELQQGEQAMAKARAKMASLLGDERVDRADRADPLLYQQRKSFTALPVNSGFVQFKSEVLALIKRAWHNTQLYTEGLRGLPLEGFHCEAAFASGLCSRFCEYVAALYAYKDLSIQQQYNSQHHTAHCHKGVWEAFHPLHSFSWAPLGTTAQGEQDYYIGGGSPQTGQWGTALAQGQYNLAPF